MSDTEQQEIDGDAQEHIRAEVRRIAGKRPMTQIATEVNVAYGTFSAWMGGSYAGNTSRVAAAAQRWIDAQEAKGRAAALLPKAPGYVETPTTRAVISTLEFAQFTPDFVMIAGGAGIGKTTAVERHQVSNPHVYVLTGEPCFSTPRMLLDCLAEVLGLTERYSSQKVSRAIQRHLRGTGALVVVDEAQHLSSQSLDQMRTLHDLSRVGIALVGNETVYNRLEGHGRQAQFAQLYSRVGMRVSRATPQAGDIAALLDAWGVAAGPERTLLTDIAKHPGALRGMTKTLRLAHVITEGGSLTTDAIRRAWEKISGGVKFRAEAA